MTLIKCCDVAFSYDCKKVIEGLNFSVSEGDYLCVLGTNGSGKSTLINGILGLKSPSEGEIQRIAGLEGSGVGYLPQQTVVQKDFPVVVREVVNSGCIGKLGIKPFYSSAQKSRVEETMKKLGIQDIATKSFCQLSGGQKQRVLLARALCAADKLLLLDEPTSGLDPVVTHEMYELLERLNREDGITIIMVSHDVSIASHGATHILHLGGTQRFFGKAEDYIHTDLAKEYLGGCGD